MTTDRSRQPDAASHVSLTLDVIIAGTLAVAIVIALHGGLQFWLGPARISAHDPVRPLLVGVILSALRVWLARRALPGDMSASVARIGFLSLLGVVFGTWLLVLVTFCGGADSYGYVSASRLIRSGRLSYVEPIAGYLGLTGAANVVAPLGYRAAADGLSIVPAYPIGLPVVMGLLAAMFGDGAEFYASPLLGVLTAIVAYGIAGNFTDRIGAALSALLVVVTPIFVNQAIQPMSDVAATLWLLVSFWLLSRPAAGDRRPGHGRLVQCGLAAAAAGMAFLTRPVLLGAVAVLFLIAFVYRGWRAAAVFGAAFTPFLLFQAWLHWHLYGAVLASGYGGASYLFTLDRIPRNLLVYFTWVNHSASPLFLPTLALGAFAFGSTRWWGAAVAVLAGVTAPYLFYFTYDDWQATRFLLPGLALGVIVCAVTIRNLSMRWLPRFAGVLAVVSIAWVAAAGSYRYLDEQGTFVMARQEAKYPQVGARIDESAPRNTVVFAFLHSGSVRFYAGRPTVRWDLMTADDLRVAVATLKARGWDSWAVIDGPDEAAAFWPRLEAAGSLEMDPKERVQGVQVVALRPR